MSISLQSASKVSWGGTLDSASPWGHNLPLTVADGVDRLLVVIVTGADITSTWHVKYGGVDMTLGFAQPKSISVTNSIWYMINPPVGTADIFVGVDSWWGATTTVTAFVLDGVNQTAPLGTPDAQSGSWITSPFAQAIAAADGDATISAICMYSGSAPVISPGAGQEAITATINNGADRYARHSVKLGTSTSVSNSWSGGTSAQTAVVAIAVFGSAAGGSPNASAEGGTGTITVTGTGGEATGGSSGTNASADGGTGTITVTGAGGEATATSTGSFTTDAMENNTGAGLLAPVAVVWTWYKGAIGTAPTSTTHGAETTNSSGVITATGLPAGAGFLLVETADGGVYYHPGTVT